MKELSVIKQDAIITVNFEEVKESLIKTMEQYKGIVVTEEQLKICKETQKDLSKMKSNIDNYRKAIKKEMEQPIKAFEKQCKELISLVEEAESPIKEGIKVFDEKRLQEKKDKATILLNAEMISQEVKGSISIEEIKINLSTTQTAIREEIESKVKALKEQEEQEEEDNKLFIGVLEDINSTIVNKVNMKMVQLYKEKGLKNSEVIEKIKQDAIIMNMEVVPVDTISSNVLKEVLEHTPVEKEIQPQGKAFEVVLKVNDDISKIKALKEYMNHIGIKYEVVEQRRV